MGKFCGALWDNHVFGLFLVCFLEKDTGMGVGMDSFFCEVRVYTASLLFPCSLAEMRSDVAFASNHLKLTFAIAILFI